MPTKYCACKLQKTSKGNDGRKIVCYNGDDWKGAEQMKKIIPALVAIVLIFVIVAASLGVKIKEKYSYSKEKADWMQSWSRRDGISPADRSSV